MGFFQFLILSVKCESSLAIHPRSLSGLDCAAMSHVPVCLSSGLLYPRTEQTFTNMPASTQTPILHNPHICTGTYQLPQSIHASSMQFHSDLALLQLQYATSMRPPFFSGNKNPAVMLYWRRSQFAWQQIIFISERNCACVSVHLCSIWK